jgi:hypothetical protein
VLEKQAEHGKARYWRGRAHFQLNALDKAEADAVVAARVSPNGTLYSFPIAHPWPAAPPRATVSHLWPAPKGDAVVPTDAGVRALLAEVQARQRDAEAKSRAALTGFFNRA